MNEAIVIEHLTKRFGNRVAVNDLTLRVAEGELLALLGLNGAGKSTTVRLLSCLCRADAGEAWVYGKYISREQEEVKALIGVSPQESATAQNLTVHENLELLARLHGMDRVRAMEKVTELERIFSLDKVRSQKSKTLSGGWQRRLSIAMALVSTPKVLFLDEPTLGLDVLARRELWDFIRSLKGKMTVILTTHYLEEAEMLADRVAIMAEGRLCALGTVAELKVRTACQTFEDAFVTLAKGGTER
ncbi:MAG: ATP-binding cassette domain-containing protein [Clostridia bacterium]|nr:ATP-binding cassette domain-containing protein [Clostridia bacterium]